MSKRKFTDEQDTMTTNHLKAMTRSSEQLIDSIIAVVAAAVITAPLIAPAPAQASVVYLPATDELRVVSDGNPGIYVEYGVGKTYPLWNDESAKNLSQGEDNSGSSSTWSLWEESWGPLTGKIALAMRKWREHPTEKQMATIKPEDRQKWKKDMFATANSPKRFPAGQSSSTPATEENLYTNQPALRLDGCPEGTQRFTVDRRSGFLGLGTKKVDIGCMTQAEANRWHIEQQNSQPTYVPPTYQPRRNCTSNIYGNQVFTNCY
jgi:hypothetical protein